MTYNNFETRTNELVANRTTIDEALVSS